MARFSEAYVDRLLTSERFDALVGTQGVLLGWPGLKVDDPRYGLPPSLFAFSETLTWFSQTIRSGGWTYFEATPPERQEALLEDLRDMAPPDVVRRYEEGIWHWQDESVMQEHDRWVSANEAACNRWLHTLLRCNREDLVAVLGPR